MKKTRSPKTVYQRGCWAMLCMVLLKWWRWIVLGGMERERVGTSFALSLLWLFVRVAGAAWWLGRLTFLIWYLWMEIGLLVAIKNGLRRTKETQHRVSTFLFPSHFCWSSTCFFVENFCSSLSSQVHRCYSNYQIVGDHKEILEDQAA